MKTNQFSARRISLGTIRKRLLDEHEKCGLIRNHGDEYYQQLTDDDIKTQLTSLYADTPLPTERDALVSKLKSLHHRQLKM